MHLAPNLRDITARQRLESFKRALASMTLNLLEEGLPIAALRRGDELDEGGPPALDVVGGKFLYECDATRYPQGGLSVGGVSARPATE
jgi:hypothetical protein